MEWIIARLVGQARVNKLLRIGHWTTAAAALLLTTSDEDAGVAVLADKPFPPGIHDTNQPQMHDTAPDLDLVVADISNPKTAMAPDTAENYIGRIIVKARVTH